MPRLIIEHFDPPSSAHAARLRTRAAERAADRLAGRRVWCAAATPRGREDAVDLGARLRAAGAGLTAAPLDVDEGPALLDLGRRMDALLRGRRAAAPARLDGDDRARCAEVVAAAEAAVGREVGAGDVVVVHDPVAALAAQELRARGAHVVWRLPPDAAASGAARAALELLRRYTGDVDAYISSAVAPPVHGRRAVRRVAVLMPGADVLAAKEVTGPEPGDELAWRSALADVVTDDHAEHVGGTVHVRPAVGVR